jgi:hypothetical protein
LNTFLRAGVGWVLHLHFGSFSDRLTAVATATAVPLFGALALPTRTVPFYPFCIVARAA